MILVIAEKPSLGKSIAEALSGGNGTSKDGCIYKGDYVVTWLFGHMLTLKEPEDYDETFKKWDINSLPIFFDNWELKIGKDSNTSKDGNNAYKKTSKAEKVKLIGQLLKQSDSVIHAGDPDDEGQLLVDELLRWFHYTKPVKRLDTGDTTNGALVKALAHMTDNKSHENEGWSAYARSVADFMIGINMSRFFTCLNNTKLTVGRVQTPTLGLVVARDLQIEGHKKTVYYNILADIEINGKTVSTKYVPDKNDSNLEDGRILSKSYAEKIVKSLYDGTKMKVSGICISKETKKEPAPLPFNLVKLQSYCSVRFGYTPSDVMSITQSLRENYKAITYNRSDCQYLSDEQYKEAPATVAAVVKNINFTPAELDTTLKSKCFNSSNITAHTAIIPTNNSVNVKAMKETERNVYMAICKYYLAQFLPNAIKEITKLLLNRKDGSSLQATSTEVLKPGYLAIFKDAQQEPQSDLSLLPSGTHTGEIVAASCEEKETKPPARYTKASLNEDMTRIAKYVTDPKAKQMLLEKDKDKKGENGSIGTSATRASIIDDLVTNGYLKEDGKTLVSTPIGREFYTMLPDGLKKPDMTAEWWAVQEDIKYGKKRPEDLESDVMTVIKDVLAQKHELIKSAGTTSHTSIGVCPRCGGNIVEGAKGFGCSNWKNGCKFVIWKKSKNSLFSKQTISESIVKNWLAGKPVQLNRLYSANKNKIFSAMVTMDDSKKGQYGPDYELSFDGVKIKKKK